MKRAIKIVAASMTLVMLTACSSLPFGGGEKKREAEKAEKAQRVPLIAFDGVLEPDPQLSELSVLLPAAEERADWVQTGARADKAAGHVAGGKEFKVAWKTNAGAGSSRKRRLVAPPVVSGGVVYILDARQKIQAIDAITGKKRWTKQLKPMNKRDRNAVGGGIAIAGDRIIVASGYGFVAALSISDGQEIWSKLAQAPVTGSPTIGPENVYVTSSNNEILVMRLTDGETVWSDQAIAESARVLSSPAPALGADILVAPFSSGELIAYLPANGRRLWTNSLSQGGRYTPISAINDIAGRPVISEGLVFAASQSGLLAAIDELTGTIRWSHDFGSIQTPAVAGQFVFAVNTDGQVVCLDKNDGGVVWVRQLPRFKNEKKRKNRIVWTGPLIVSDQVLLASSEGDVTALSPQTGETLRDMEFGDSIYIEPIAAGELIYLLTDEGRLIAIR